MNTDWFVVQTQPRGEARAAFNLQRQGFVTYFPQFLKRRRHARKIEVVQAPLFPRYLFVTADSAMSRWRSIHSTFGVTQLVCCGDCPARLGGGVVASLKNSEEGGLVKLTSRSFAPGEKVRLIDGAFAHAIGLVEEMRDEERVSVLLDLLGRKVRVLIDELSLVRA